MAFTYSTKLLKEGYSKLTWLLSVNQYTTTWHVCSLINCYSSTSIVLSYKIARREKLKRTNLDPLIIYPGNDQLYLDEESQMCSSYSLICLQLGFPELFGYYPHIVLQNNLCRLEDTHCSFPDRRTHKFSPRKAKWSLNPSQGNTGNFKVKSGFICKDENPSESFSSAATKLP